MRMFKEIQEIKEVNETKSTQVREVPHVSEEKLQHAEDFFNTLFSTSLGALIDRNKEMENNAI